MKIPLPEINPDVLIDIVKIDIPPEELYRRFSGKDNTALLNSSLETDVGRYSFIGLDPFCSLKVSGKKITFTVNGKETVTESDPFVFLDHVFAGIKVNNPTPFPFISGGIGFFSYDLKHCIEKLPDLSKKDLIVPDIYFVFYRTLLIFDKRNPGETVISVLDIPSDNYINAHTLLNDIRTEIETCPSRTDPKDKPGIIHDTPRDLCSNFTKEGYIRAIEKVKEYIRSGDIYQVCVSQRFSADWSDDPYELYRKLDQVSPSPFSAYLNFGDTKVLSSSPELFFRVRDNNIETRPMKGTRPREKDPDKDQKMKNDLLKSSKDNAELSMIVDLERNDLGKISIPGSVSVSEHRRLEKYPTVFQTISIIKGTLPGNTSPSEILKAVFPGGSISGCPKIRAMEIIEELEPTKRGIYTGAIGYLSFHDTMDLNIAIRTIIVNNRKAYYQTGGGITIDSDPELEYEETLHKAKAFFQAIK